MSFEDWRAVSQGATFFEFDWLSIDNQEQIAIFSTAGQGYVPLKVFASYDSFTRLDALLYARERLATAAIVPRQPGDAVFWQDWPKKAYMHKEGAILHAQTGRSLH